MPARTRTEPARTAPSTEPSTPISDVQSVADQLCLLIVVAFAGFIPVARAFAGTDDRLEYVTALAAVALAALGRWAPPIGAAMWLSALPLIGFGAVAVSMPSLRAAIPLIVLVAVTPFVLRDLVVRIPNLARWAATAMILTQTMSALIGIAQFAGARPLGIATPFGRAQGLAGHPNVLGLMCGLVVLITVDALVTRRAKTLLLAPVIAINTIALVASGSLSTLGASVVAVVTLLWCRRRLSATTFVLLLALPITYLVAGFLPAFDRLAATVEFRLAVVSGSTSGGGAASIEVRSRTYAWALDHINQSPVFGVGFTPSASGTFDGTTVVHNSFLRAWYQGGLPHAVWFVLLTVVVVSRLILPAVARRRPDLALPASGVTLVSVFAMTSAFLGQPAYWLPALFFIALVEPVKPERPQPPPRVVPAARARARPPLLPPVELGGRHRAE